MSEPDAHYDHISRRLSAIESSISDIRGLLERMVRVEERVIAGNQNLQRIEANIAALGRRVEVVESSASRSGWIVGGIERLIWLFIAAAATWIGSKN